MVACMNRRAAVVPLVVSTVVLTAVTSSTESSASPGAGHGTQPQIGELHRSARRQRGRGGRRRDILQAL
jgi:hypothetical protein